MNDDLFYTLHYRICKKNTKFDKEFDQLKLIFTSSDRILVRTFSVFVGSWVPCFFHPTDWVDSVTKRSFGAEGPLHAVHGGPVLGAQILPERHGHPGAAAVPKSERSGPLDAIDFYKISCKIRAWD